MSIWMPIIFGFGGSYWGAMLALLVCQLGYYSSVPELATALHRPLALVLTAILAGLMIAAMAVRGRRANIAVMAALVGRYLVVYLLK